MNLDHLIFMQTLAQIGNYTKAAEALHITQPTLSYAISALELELDTKLFKKDGRKTILTENGQIFLTHVNHALTEINIAKDVIHSKDLLPTKDINIATTRFYFVEQCIYEFQKIQEYSDIRIRSSHTGQDDFPLILSNSDHHFDLIFSSIPLNISSYISYELEDLEFMMLVPSDSPLAEKDSIDLRETEPYPAVYKSTYPAYGLGDYIARMYQTAKIKPNFIAFARSFHTLYEIACSNRAIGIFPNCYRFEGNNMCIKPISYPIIKSKLYINYEKDRELNPAAEAFRKFIMQRNQK